jgi:threonine dehydrogenase-like Zn-dependent dehydrogenase
MRRGDIIGHEPLGVVEEVGSGVSHVQPGDRVVVPFNVACGGRGGTLSLTGVYAGLYPLAPIGDIFDRQLAIRMGQANVLRWVDELLPLVVRDDDPLGTGDLVTHVLPLADAPSAYERFQRKKDGMIKVVLRP